MSDHVTSHIDALVVLDAMAAGGVDVCVGGGWGVDALIGETGSPICAMAVLAFARLGCVMVRTGDYTVSTCRGEG